MIFLDIHTHSSARYDDHCILIQNLYPTDEICPNTFVSMGIHPWYIAEDYERQLEDLRSSATNPSVIALGECGLDKICDTPYQIQRTAFMDQVYLSERLGLPLMLHIVRAWDDLLAVKKNQSPSQPWIVHGFRGGLEQARQLIHSGLFLSFGYHFNPDSLRYAYESNAAFLETDDNPQGIEGLYHEVSMVLDISLEELQRSVLALAKSLFPRLLIH